MVNTNQHTNIKAKILYLNRNAYDMTKSHCEFEQWYAGYNNKTKCKMHVDVLEAYSQHIGREFEIMETKMPGQWRKLSYEWLLVDSQCNELLESLVKFFDWDLSKCRLKEACDKIKANRVVPKKRPVNCDEYRYIQSKNLSNPSIPYLDGNYRSLYTRSDELEKECPSSNQNQINI